MNFIKSSSSLSSSQRRSSSDQINGNYFLSNNTPSQNKINSSEKKSSGLSKKKNKPSTSSSNQLRTNLGSSLKGLLSPVDYKLVETPKHPSLKLDEGIFQPVFKGTSARNASEYQKNYKENEQIEDIFYPGTAHNKKRSLDMNRNLNYEQISLSKAKMGNSHILFQNQAQQNPNIYLKDVQYMVNPMFSPVNGPPKQSTRSQNNSGDADTLQSAGLNYPQESN